MPKPLVLVVVAAGVAALIRKRKSAKADAALWREATTAPR
jgi:hypothetical protein